MDRSGRYPEEENIQLIIRSEDTIYFTIGIIGIIAVVSLIQGYLFFVNYYFTNRADKGDVSIVVILIFIVMYLWLSDWCALGRTLIMSKQGCMVKFLKFQRFYTWDELAIKRYENYRYMLGDGSKYCPAPYKEGVFFSHRKARKWKRITPRTYCSFCRPWSTFFVNFYPYGLWDDWQELQTNKKEINFMNVLNFERKKRKHRDPEIYPVDKALFFHYMDLWGVDIKGRSEETPPWEEFL